MQPRSAVLGTGRCTLGQMAGGTAAVPGAPDSDIPPECTSARSKHQAAHILDPCRPATTLGPRARRHAPLAGAHPLPAQDASRHQRSGSRNVIAALKAGFRYSSANRSICACRRASSSASAPSERAHARFIHPGPVDVRREFRAAAGSRARRTVRRTHCASRLHRGTSGPRARGRRKCPRRRWP